MAGNINNETAKRAAIANHASLNDWVSAARLTIGAIKFLASSSTGPMG